MKKMIQEDFINKANEIWNNKFDYSEVTYTKGLIEVKVICPEHGPFMVKPQWHLQKSQCPECSKLVRKVAMTKFNQETKRLTTEEFIEKARDIHGDKYDYSKVVYVNATTKVIITCPEHGDFEQYQSHHFSGSGCRKCANKIININNGRSYTQEKFIEVAEKKEIPNVSFEKTVYKSKKEKIIVTCSIHGDYETNAEMILKGCGCPKCNTSKNELLIAKHLTTNNILFERQKKIEGLKHIRSLKFDFYLPDHNILVEFDGEQHFKSVEYWGGENKFKELQLKDALKNEYCKLNNIPLLRIKYSDTNMVELIDNFIKENSCI